MSDIKRLVMALRNRELEYLRRMDSYNTLVKSLAMESHDEILDAIADLIDEAIPD